MTEINQKRSRLVLVGLGILFIGPILLSVALVMSDWRPSGGEIDQSTTYGTLLKPVVAVEPFESSDTEGRAFTADDLKGTWTMVLVVGSDCDAECQLRMQEMSNFPKLRETMELMNWITVLSEPPSEEFAEWMALEVPNAIMLTANDSTKGLTDALKKINGMKANSVYLVSRLKQIGIYWSPDQTDTKKILNTDVKPLLKFRRNG